MGSPNSEPLAVDAWTDFLCPYSFLTCLALRRLREEIALEIRWRSMLTHPPGLPPLTPGMRRNAKRARTDAAKRARSEFDLEFDPGPLELDTLPAHLAFKHAERLGFGDRCHLSIMEAYWLRQARIDRLDVLEGIARSSGSNGIPWDDPALPDSVDGDIGLAQALDLYFVPALRFGERTIVAGAEPYEHLRSVALLAAEAATHPAGHTDVPHERPGGGLGAAAS